MIKKDHMWREREGFGWYSVFTSNFIIFKDFNLHLLVCGVWVYVGGGQRATFGSRPLLLSCGLQGLNSDPQAWQPAPFLAESSCQPHSV